MKREDKDEEHWRLLGEEQAVGKKWLWDEMGKENKTSYVPEVEGKADPFFHLLEVVPHIFAFCSHLFEQIGKESCYPGHLIYALSMPLSLSVKNAEVLPGRRPPLEQYSVSFITDQSSTWLRNG